MSDQCKHCRVRGDLQECLKTPCGQHESWMTGQLRERIAELEASPWTLCSERMPDDHRPSYAVMDKEGSWHKVYIDGFWREDAIRGTVRFVPSHWIHSEGHRCELDEFTHWQLIEAPE